MRLARYPGCESDEEECATHDGPSAALVEIGQMRSPQSMTSRLAPENLPQINNVVNIFPSGTQTKTTPPAPKRLRGNDLKLWAWVELNYRPHAYQAGSYEHELASEVPTSLHFTNILLSMSCI